MFQWEDGTVGYFSQYIVHTDPPSCGILAQNMELVMHSCFARDVKRFLCQEDGGQEDTPLNRNCASGRCGPQPSKPTKPSVHFPHVYCHSGHLTHEFLACDLQSACWHSGGFEQRSTVSNTNIDTMSLCQSPLSALFTCRNGVERVPYSLVCDHSTDCLDTSDEDFCVLLSCSISRQFECTNKQVRSTEVLKGQDMVCFGRI